MKKITQNEYFYTISLYIKWKELNSKIKEIYPRGINFHEVFSEFIVCYINDYYHSIQKGSEDAFTNNMVKVQIKSTSNFNSDLTSFGPNSQFEILEFARLDQDKDCLFLYKIPVDSLNNIYVNHLQTFQEQQKEKRRPRFSIINNLIIPNNINPYAVVNMLTGEYKFI